MQAKRLGPVAALALMAAVSSASAYMVDDAYYGATDHGYGDVIASNAEKNIFDIAGADAYLSGTSLTVKVYTGFAGQAGIYPQYTGSGDGIGYGDLFLSTGWSPSGTAGNHYLTDDAANGNHWAYAFALDDAFSATGGSGALYALRDAAGGDNNPDALRADFFIDCGSNCIYRNGQAVAVNTDNLQSIGNGIWSVGDDFLSFTFDIQGLSLDPGNLGLHWTMDCANDVIEGLASVAVPEPGSLALLGLGLAGLGGGLVRQRRQARVRA